ncbi:MAG TPA: hypothetical protein VD794_08240 [Flavisolibacter sp.]|nr:hypothetical protein [Flavisolibacter sp.]
MEATNQTTHLQSNDLFEPQRKGLPGMLNVLTILTFIGCGIAYISGIWSLYSSSNYDKQMAEFEEALDKAGDNEMATNLIQGSIEMFQKSYDNRYIIFITTIVFTTLCLIGAMQMRKLKRSGFTIYTIGELAPIAVTAALVGFSLAGGITIIISAFFAVLFVILYATQRKYLVNP